MNDAWQLKSIYEQVEIIAQEFGLSSEETFEFLETSFEKAILPVGAVGWCALPALEAMTERFFPDAASPADIYQKLTGLVLEKISTRFWQFEGLDCKSTPEKFRLSEKVQSALQAIRTHQTGSIMVIPLGFKAAASGGLAEDEFSLGSFFTACLGLTHPERYHQIKPALIQNHVVECIGHGAVRCTTCWFDDARQKWQQPIGFIPTFTI